MQQYNNVISVRHMLMTFRAV